MLPQDTTVLADYHRRTKLRPGDAAARRIDAALVPRPFKLYTDPLPEAPLPRPEPAPPPPDALGALLGAGPEAPPPLTLATLARVLHFSAGIVRRRVIGGREVAFRAASCTGAAYHLELYVVCGPLEGLEPGVYHYGVHDAILRRLRAGDYRAALAHACADDGVARAEASVVCTSVFWRNAWRYQERAYRHAFWDCGTVMANALAVARGAGAPARVLTGFVDDAVNRLVGVDGVAEAALAVATLGRAAPAAAPLAVPPLSPAEAPPSRVRLEYPAIERMHASGGLHTATEVQRYRELFAADCPSEAAEAPPVPEGIEQVVLRRGSARRFSPAPLAAELGPLLAAATAAPPVDVPGLVGHMGAHVLVHAAEGWAPGAYAFDRPSGTWAFCGPSDRGAAAHAALDQSAAGEAAVNLCYTLSAAQLAANAAGNRAYRAAQLCGGIMGGRVYLAAYALGLGATGLTFYDDLVARLLGLPPEATLVLFLVAAGRPAPRD